MSNGVTYCEELDTNLVPLYQSKEDLDKAVATLKCNECGREVALTQDVVDELWMGYYNTDNTPITGWCMNCFSTGDITDWIKKIMQ